MAKRSRKATASYKGDGKARIKGDRDPITYSGLQSQWKRIRKLADVSDFRFHDFRHDLATKLLSKTGNLKTVQKPLATRISRQPRATRMCLMKRSRPQWSRCKAVTGSPGKSPEVEITDRRSQLKR
ncbi:tyrosine-type recombinase/integrase [Mesorhizobium sp. f-mel]